MLKIRENIAKIKPSSTLTINEVSKKLETEGKKIYKFGLGQSPFPVPKIVVDELKKNAFKKDYLNVSGLAELRRLVSIYHSKKNKYSYSMDDILIGPGSKELIFLTQLATESELILPSPSWVSYAPQAKIINKKIHWIQTLEKDNWHITSQALENKCKSITNKMKLLILNSPNNPSGTIHPNLKKIAKVAKSNGVIIISDEIYAELNFNGLNESISHYYPEGTIVSSGISKWCGAGGWRLGTLVFPKELSKLHNVIRSIASETFTSVSAPIQFAAIKAYSADHSDYLDNSRRILNCIGTFLYHKLSESGIKCRKPQGGFYMLCDFSSIIQKTNQINDSQSLCEKILDETGFAMLPGSDFGIAEDQLITRIAFVDFDGEKALEMSAKKKSLDEKFIKEYCNKIYEGTNELVNWLKRN